MHMTVHEEPTTTSGSIDPLPPRLAPELPHVARVVHGLSATEGARQLAKCGPNRIETGGRFRLLRTGLGLFANPRVVILLVASIVSGILGETLSSAITVTIVLLSVALDFFQSFRSEQAASRLQSLVTLTASVVRDGRLAAIPVREVVPGDARSLVRSPTRWRKRRCPQSTSAARAPSAW
jgi:P-type Mg2+ transporter